MLERLTSPVGRVRWMLVVSSLVLPLASGGCAGAPETEDPAPDPTPGVPEHVFTLAVLADPHITSGNPEREARLAQVVQWLNEEADERRIELVTILGDIGWSGGLPVARDLLSELSMSWFPVSGDNLVQAGGVADFGVVFADQFADLEATMDDWVLSATPVRDPGAQVDFWLHNYAFGHRGVRFVTLDWASRSNGALESESADLYDFDGGTLPFLAAELDDLPDGLDEDVVLLSHNPMHRSPGAFSLAEMESINAVTSAAAHRVAAAYGGHYHFTADEPNDDGGYHVWITDAVWDEGLAVRLVEVWSDGVRYDYRQELIRLGD